MSMSDFSPSSVPMSSFSGPSSTSSSYNYHPHTPSHDTFSQGLLESPPDFEDNNEFYLSSWVQEPEQISTSLPLSIPMRPYTHFSEQGYHHHDSTAFSPTQFAALHPLPNSVSPPSSSLDHYMAMRDQQRYDSIAPHETSLSPPPWATQLWDHTQQQQQQNTYTLPSVSPTLLAEDLPDMDRTQRPPRARRNSTHVGEIFQSASAPSAVHIRPPPLSRGYSRRAESVSVSDDRDATVRRKKRISVKEEDVTSERSNDGLPTKSILKPPKLAPSAWQLYFTDWIARQQATSTRKLNVAQAAKEAGAEYACLTPAEKEPYQRRSKEAKEIRERKLESYMRTLTPDDIKRENAFRTAQRKSGKSRKSNIKDPNAPKKPLSAYFMFLQRIRSSKELVEEVFGTETETTKQSVLAAAKWRSMTDDERKPFLARAEQDKLHYEAARRIYEDQNALSEGEGFEGMDYIRF